MLRLIIGNKNYSSWSLRAWLPLRHAEIEFEEIRVPLDTPEFAKRIGDLSPSRRVPALHDGGLVVWESLAIAEYLAEYLAERAPAGRLWPIAEAARATARAVSCEMHAGFDALRATLPMNCRARNRRVAVDPATAADIARIQTLWRDCRRRFGEAGPWLFGAWSIADAMYAPVASRFLTYGVELDEICADYVAAVHADPHLQAWVAAGTAESETIAGEEVGGGAVQD